MKWCQCVYQLGEEAAPSLSTSDVLPQEGVLLLGVLFILLLLGMQPSRVGICPWLVLWLLLQTAKPAGVLG